MRNKIFVISFFMLLVVGTFYWFAWRPSEIRRNCEAYAGSKEDISYNSGKRRANNLYRQCLVRNGMGPESLFVNVSN